MKSTSTSKEKQNYHITLKVKVETEMPEDEGVYITGNIPELGDWDPAGVCLDQNENHEFEIDFPIAQEQIVECKITRGCWKSQGIYDKTDVPPSNLIIRARKNRVIPIKIIDWLDKQIIHSDPIKGRIVTHNDIPCPGLKYSREIQVWLPENYDKTDEPFSVLYMHDGQNLFEPANSFAGVDWKVDETITELLRTDKITNVIVVGIPNSPDRMRELNMLTPEGKAYAKYVVKNVKPFIDEHYRTIPTAEHTCISGSSMGGLMSFQMACKYPEVFGLAGCFSPAFPKTYGKIFQQVKKPGYVPVQVKFYIDTGEFEPPIVETYFKMMKKLKELGLKEGHNLLGYYDAGATHCEAAWAKRFHIPMKFLFGKKNSHT